MFTISVNDELKLNNTIVTIGKFDGIHKGHEKLFDELTNKANGRQKVVLTFETSPDKFLKNNANKTIVTDREKQMLCASQNIDVYMKMPMVKNFLGLEPEEFISKILKDKIGATTIVCGPDFRFGAMAKGDVDFLKSMEKKYNYNLVVIEKEKYHNKDISSTDVRTKISEGKIEEVNEMLDHPYSIIGKVEEGKHLGRTLDFPTANITPDETKLLPPNGVYATKVVFKDKSYDAITNIGVNPTIAGNNPMKVECHLVNFSGDLYDEIIVVNFYKFVRPERKFASLDELKEQISQDVKTLLN